MFLPPVHWQQQALQSDRSNAIGSTVIPFIQLLRLGLIYIHAHPLINYKKNVSVKHSVEPVTADYLAA